MNRKEFFLQCQQLKNDLLCLFIYVWKTLLLLFLLLIVRYVVVVVASTFCFSVYDYLSFVDAVVIIVAVVVVIVVVMLTIYFAVQLLKLSS